MILNSEFALPFDRSLISFPPKNFETKSRITAKSKMTVFDGKLALFFDDNKVAIKQYDKLKWNEYAIVYYLIYKTYLYYNCLIPENENVETAPEVDSVVFKVNRYVTRYIKEDENTYRYIDIEPCEIILQKKEISHYLKALDATIWYAIIYYILGCNTQRYFLFEFYKCLEVIKNYFENETKMKVSLNPHGFIESDYKNTKRLANDRMKPLSIARHAPPKGITVHSIDTKWLFDDPMGRKAFETGEKACRIIIDSYLQFRTACNS